MSETKRLAIGLDAGNGYGKAYTIINGERKQKTLPSGFLYKRVIETDDLGFGTKKESFNTYSTKLGETEYVFGDVEDHKDFNSLSGKSERYNQEIYQMYISVLLYELIGDDISDCELYVMTGVPSAEKGTKNEELLKRAILNAPTLFVNGRKVIINVVDVQVMAQPLGTLMNVVLDDDSVPIDEEIMEENVLLIDIGTGTTDFEIIESGQPQASKRFTMNIGMSDVYNHIAKHISNQTHMDIPFANIRKQFDEDEFMISKRQSVFIKDVKENILREIYEKMELKLRNNIPNARVFDRVLLSGGGATVFKEKFEQLKDFDPTIVDCNQLANAKGFYKFGYSFFE